MENNNIERFDILKRTLIRKSLDRIWADFLFYGLHHSSVKQVKSRGYIIQVHNGAIRVIDRSSDQEVDVDKLEEGDLKVFQRLAKATDVLSVVNDFKYLITFDGFLKSWHILFQTERAGEKFGFQQVVLHAQLMEQAYPTDQEQQKDMIPWGYGKSGSAQPNSNSN